MSDNENSMCGARQALMRACAVATESELAVALKSCEPFGEVSDIRAPEVGLVMLRGRMGGDGAPFNFGEATVTRAVVRLGSGTHGYSYLLGRSKHRARTAAIIDALGQDEVLRGKLEQHFVCVVAKREAGERAAKRRKTAATRVNFFTLVRGED